VLLTSSNAYGNEPPPPRLINKGEPAPADGLWVHPDFMQLLVSGCEKTKDDLDAFEEAFNRCEEKLKAKKKESGEGWILVTLGFAGGVILTLVTVLGFVSATD
jgi:hypothetical protein